MNRALIRLLAIVISIIYPFLWWWCHQRGISMLYPALLMASTWAVRGMLEQGFMRSLSMILAGIFLLLAIAQIPGLMLYYPLLVNGLMLILFARSLYVGMPVIERFARLQRPDLPEEAIAYTRKVTVWWCGFFMVNGLITLGLILLGNVAWWAAYTGAISYGLMAGLFAGEWIYRRWILKITH